MQVTLTHGTLDLARVSATPACRLPVASNRPLPPTVDDGGGVFISWEALSVIRKLGLKPRRSLRAIAWTCEEMGGGARAFWNSEWNDPANYSECGNGRLGL